jgi:GT2 family glycosyltransferase/SAM-dependent methyltransferase
MIGTTATPTTAYLRMSYSWDAQVNLYRSASIDDLPYSDETRAEEHLLHIVAKANDRSTFSQELLEAISDWPTEYHLSRSRHCLVRPLNITAENRVLELGCGCGAITRYLGEIGADVVGVEGSLCRARIAAERCRGLDNVRVVADDLLRFELDERFDTILLVGVLEYAALFSGRENPFGHYLRSVSRFLSPGGRVVVAIENKLGLKYFNGCREDHVGVQYFGIQDLYGPRMPRTFGRQELVAQLSAAGLPHVCFYYPFPDYKLPSVVLSDAALTDREFDPVDLLARSHSRDYSGSPLRNFDDALVFSTLHGDGLLAELSNSFLVVATAEPKQNTNELAFTYSVQRKPEFATQTKFIRLDHGIKVVKEALHHVAGGRLFVIGDMTVSNQLADSDYQSGRQILWKLLMARAAAGDVDAVAEALHPWMSFLLKRAGIPTGRLVDLSAGFSRLSSYVLPGDLLDCTPFNLLDTGNELVNIDVEWHSDRDVELGWVVTRGILWSLSSGVPSANPLQSITEVAEALCKIFRLSVSESEVQIWIDREIEFQAAVTGLAFPGVTDRSTSNGNRRFASEISDLNRDVATRVGQIAGLEEMLTIRDGQIAALNQAVGERDGQIAALNQAVSERDGQITALDQAVGERDGQITALDQAVGERDGQIAALNHAVGERDGQIAALNQTVSERDGQIAALNQTVSERDGQIAALNQAVSERDGQITALDQAVGERDGQITSLDQAVGERDGQITALDQAVGERDDRVEELKQIFAELKENCSQLESRLSQSTEHAEQSQKDLMNARQRMAMIESSVSWRATSFLRAASRRFPGLQSFSYRILRLLWWILTLQLPWRLRARRRLLQARKTIAASELFDASWYLQAYPDVAVRELDPALHYAIFGATERRNPSPHFDAAWYLDHNPDVAAAGLNPLLHYLHYGRSEGRQARAIEGSEPVEIKRASTESAQPFAAKAAMSALHMTRLRVFLSGTAHLKLPSSETPDVTIILVLHNRAELTFACLTSIRECLGESDVGIEVVILDNCSTDLTSDLLARVKGARVIRKSDNVHFLRGVNLATIGARGRNILLLNNDAQLFPGSLEAAIHTLESAADIGAVGGRIVLPDGLLQEAGSIIWGDGTCVGYGRGRNPDDPEVMFRRDVDYCSGAFLLTRCELFERLNGFDERFVPAYYEEVDYCVRLWQSGFRVVYEPSAVIMHYEFASASSSAEALSLQRRNHQLFCQKHAAWLNGREAFSEKNMLVARTTTQTRKRILVIEDRVPHPKLGSGYPRSCALVQALVDLGAQVTFFPMFETVDSWLDVGATLDPSVEVFLRSTSRELRDFLDNRRLYFDAILVCRPHNMRAFLDVLNDDHGVVTGAKIIYDAEAIFATREVLRRELSGDVVSSAEASRMLAEEIGLTRVADYVLSVSSIERALFLENGVRRALLLGYPIRPNSTTLEFDDRTDILFVGSILEDDSPNADSLRWFAKEVLPHLRASLGSEIRLKVIGLNRAPSVEALNGSALDLVGCVDDLKPHFEKARVAIAPTRFAAGIPLKAHQAASFGVPMVVTDLIAGQLGWQVGRDLLAASDGPSFAAECVRLYRSPQLWESIRRNAMERVREDCSPERFRETVSQLLVHVVRRPLRSDAGAVAKTAEYAGWVARYDRLAPSDRLAILKRITELRVKPMVSVVVPLYNTPEELLHLCILSVIDQIYPHWELCLVDDASTEAHVRRICDEYARSDKRIRFSHRETNGHIAAATNSALELATGELVAFLDHDDELAEHALYMVAEELNASPDLDLIFTDEDKIDETGQRYEPWFKTDWNYDLMLSCNAMVHLAVYRRDLLLKVGGLRLGFDGSQDYDLVLRVIEHTTPERIAHIPFILYHWRAIKGSVALAPQEKLYPYEAATRVIQEHLDRTCTGAEVGRQNHMGYYRVRWPIPAVPPPVSIIVPTRDGLSFLKRAVDSILLKTEYLHYEILIVNNQSKNQETADFLSKIIEVPKVRVVEYNRPFNYSALNNWAVRQTDSPVLAFFNNDVEVLTEEWLNEMVSHVLRPQVGAVGAKLYYPNRTIQHAGIVLGIGGLAGHPHLGLSRGMPGYFGRAVCIQQFSAVTGACMLMRREVFLEVGGFDESTFAVAFNDVDICLRLRQAGYSVVWTPFAELLHHESASLGSPSGRERKRRFDSECENLKREWSSKIGHDPFYNPNLTITGGDFAPALPPRVIKPWKL